MKSTKAASRYAKSLLELAIEQNKLDTVAADLKYLEAVNTETKEFTILLNSPIINSAKKIAIYRELFGKFEALTLSFIDLITKNRREYMLPQIAISFDQLLKAHRGIVPITIVSAVALNDTTRSLIVSKIQHSSTEKLEVEEIVDSTLIGGFIVRMDDKQIDASVASQINNLKQRLTR